MQDAKHPHFIVRFKDFVDCDEWKRRKRNFSRARNATGAAEMWEGFECTGAFDDRLSDSASGLRTVMSNVVADPFEVIRGVRRPADAHQPR
jgi:hypothetical protein